MINVIPEASSAPPAARKRYAWRTIPLSILFVGSFLIATITDTFEIPNRFQGWFVAASMISFVIIVYEFIALMRSLDELQQRIHITSLAIGFGFVGVLNFLIGGFQMVYTPSDPEELLQLVSVMTFPIAILLYYLFIHIISGRYR